MSLSILSPLVGFLSACQCNFSAERNAAGGTVQQIRISDDSEKQFVQQSAQAKLAFSVQLSGASYWRAAGGQQQPPQWREGALHTPPDIHAQPLHWDEIFS